VRIDHVIYATSDLDAAAARLEAELGLKAVGGGRHEGLGTHNRIVPLGDGYLELLAIADADEARASDLAQAVQRRIEDVGDGLLGWAVAVDDVGPVADRLGIEVTTIARQGMSARLAGLQEAMREPFLPFFIARDPGVANPARAHDGPGITWIEVAGDPHRLGDWLGDADLPIRTVEGHRTGPRAMGIGHHRLGD
jgi:catechol 2,3-dioxygenase-like lactoylglutathione lyase family enzyme